MSNRFARLGLGDIFSQAYLASSWPFDRANPSTATPTAQMSGRSPLLNTYRQVAPRWAGGYSDTRKQALRDFVTDPTRPDDAYKVLAIGNYPTVTNADPNVVTPQEQLGPRGRQARAAAQIAGGALSDLTTQGLQNIYWFLNAWETLGMTAARQAMHGSAGLNSRNPQGAAGAPTGSPFGGLPSFMSNVANTASTFPVILGASAATGTLFRQPGYQAVIPDRDGDRRDSADPIGERVLRTIGRHGRLLPYEQFAEERPDVSREDYNAYRAYLYGNRSILKGTMDGIHGPEVNFLGRSMPVLTGMVPMVGGVLGGRMGVRAAARSLENQGVFNEARTADAALRNAREAANELREIGRPGADPALSRAASNQARVQRRIAGRMLGGSIGGAAIGLGVTAAGTQLLEQIRRAHASEASRRRREERNTARQTRENEQQQPSLLA